MPPGRSASADNKPKINFFIIYRFASSVLTCKYTGLLRTVQEIRRKYFGERKKGHSPRPGNIRPANRPPIGRPIRPLTTNRPDFRPRFPDSLFPCFPVRFPGSGPDLVLEKIPEPQTVRPIDNPADSPADRPSHKQTAPQTAPAARRRPGTKKRRPHSFLCGHPVIGYGGASSPPVLFSAEITLRPLSWRQPSWPTWPRQPPWRSSERPVRRCRRASSSRPKR